MGTYFKPLRRKVGVVSLALACFFAIGWIRSAKYCDIIYVQLGRQRTLGVISDFQLLALKYSIYEKNEDYQFVSWLIGLPLGPLPTLMSDSYGDLKDWNFRTHGFACGVDNIAHYHDRYFIMPYWSIVILLTLFSAWMLFSWVGAPKLPVLQAEKSGVVSKRRLGWILSASALIVISSRLMLWHFESGLNAPPKVTRTSAARVPTDGPTELSTPPTISKVTTFVTEQVKADGWIDYFAAVNQRTSEGIKVIDNAAALFVKAGIGLNESGGQGTYSQLLGVDTTEFVKTDFLEFGDWPEERQRDLHVVVQKPWRRENFPQLAEWLGLNEVGLNIVVEGTRRPQCYFPIEPSPRTRYLMQHSQLPHFESRSAARRLAARAMLRIGEDKFSEAMQDILACHRLGRMVGQSPFIATGLIGNEIDGLAYAAGVALLERAHLSADEALAFQRELRQAPPLNSLVDKLGFGDRLLVLDAATWKERTADLSLFSATESAKLEARSRRLAVMRDECLRRINEKFDEVIQVCRISAFSQRAEALEVYSDPVKDAARKFRETQGDLSLLRAQLQDKTPADVGRQLGDTYFALLFPDVDRADEGEINVRVCDDVLQVGCALAAWYATHTEYPERLDLLVPSCISEIPRDRFTDQELHYTRNDGGYLLYSVGTNCIDEKGETGSSKSASDDIGLRVNPSTKPTVNLLIEHAENWRKIKERGGEIIFYKNSSGPCLSHVSLEEPLSDSDLELLSPFSDLETLFLESEQFTDAGMEHIAKLAGLNQLRLKSCNVTAAGFNHLTPLRLGRLELVNLALTKESVQSLAELRNVEEIHFENCRVPDPAFLKYFAESNVSGLILQQFEIDQAGMSELKRLGQLKHLFLADIKTSLEAMHEVTQLRHLRQLSIRRCVFSDTYLAVVAEFESIEHLSVDGADISNVGLRSLTKSPNLRTLAIINCSQVTEAAVDEFRASRPNVSVMSGQYEEN